MRQKKKHNMSKSSKDFLIIHTDRFRDMLKRFYGFAKNRGVIYATVKTINYFKHMLLTKKPATISRNTCIKYDGDPKPSDILLVQCPPWGTRTPPLGIAYLSSYLRKHGYKVFVYDLNATLYNDVAKNTKHLWRLKNYNFWLDDGLFKKTWDCLRQSTASHISKILEKVDTKYIGLSVNDSSICFTIELLKIIKGIKREVKIIIGGCSCNNAYIRRLFPEGLVDVFVIGEGEETLVEVIEALCGRMDTKSVTGAIFNNDSGYDYKPRLPIMKLDGIPWPTFVEFDLAQYAHRIVPLLTSRGCIGKCSFCSDCVFLRPYRFRSAYNIFMEIKYHVENNHTRVFELVDLLCNGNIRELNQLCDLIVGSRLKILWSAQAIPCKEMTYELLCKLKKSGCRYLVYGIESFSNNVLRGMRKTFTKEAAEKVLKDTARAGIDTHVNIIVGFPGETQRDFEETCEAIKKNRKYITWVSWISTCLIRYGSDLDTNPHNYEVIWHRDLKTRINEWTSVDGKNTYEARKRKAEKILELAEELGLPNICFLPDS